MMVIVIIIFNVKDDYDADRSRSVKGLRSEIKCYSLRLPYGCWWWWSWSNDHFFYVKDDDDADRSRSVEGLRSEVKYHGLRLPYDHWPDQTRLPYDQTTHNVGPTLMILMVRCVNIWVAWVALNHFAALLLKVSAEWKCKKVKWENTSWVIRWEILGYTVGNLG